MYRTGCTNGGSEMHLRRRGQTVLSPVNQFSITSSTLNAPVSAPATVLIGATDATGLWEPYFGVPYNAAYVGVPLTMQSAVLDLTRPGIQLAASNGLV